MKKKFFAFVEIPYLFSTLGLLKKNSRKKSLVNFFYILAMNYLINAECINTNTVPFWFNDL